MNKFVIMSCVNFSQDEAEDMGYSGPVVALGCVNDPRIVLFFPVTAEKMNLLNYILKNQTFDINTEILGIYKTMIDSWTNGDRFLSGILMDCDYDDKAKEDLMQVKLLISSSVTGQIDSIVPINFVNAIVLSAIQRIELIVSTKLLNKLLPEDIESEDDGDDHPFPEDKKILDIVKDIMEGKEKKD